MDAVQIIFTMHRDLMEKAVLVRAASSVAAQTANRPLKAFIFKAAGAILVLTDVVWTP